MAVGQLSQDELDEIYAFAVDLGRKAGDLLMERVEQRISGNNGPQTFEEKDNAVDIVTQTDEGKLRDESRAYRDQPRLTSMTRRRGVYPQCHSEQIPLTPVRLIPLYTHTSHN